LYEATRDHAGRSDHARVEADALRAAVAHAEDRHRRELMLLGTEHGNAYASARRALAAAERKIGDLESSVEEAETRLKSREDQYREERAKRLGLDEELATLRHDLLTRDKDSVAAAMKDEELQRALKATEEAKREAARLAEELDLAAGDFGAADERGRRLSEQLDATRRELIDARSEAAAAGVASGELPGKVQRLEAEVRRRVRLCDRLFLTRRSVSTLDRVSFQLTDERTLFVLMARPSGS
jgi:chromosome segregation ATPase